MRNPRTYIFLFILIGPLDLCGDQGDELAEFRNGLPEGIYTIQKSRAFQPMAFSSREEGEAWLAENPGPPEPPLYQLYFTGDDYMIRLLSAEGDQPLIQGAISEDGSWFHEGSDSRNRVKYSDTDLRDYEGGRLGPHRSYLEKKFRELRMMGLQHIDWETIDFHDGNRITGKSSTESGAASFHGKVEQDASGRIEGIAYHVDGDRFAYKLEIGRDNDLGLVTKVRVDRGSNIETERWQFHAEYLIQDVSEISNEIDFANYWKEILEPRMVFNYCPVSDELRYFDAQGDEQVVREAPDREYRKGSRRVVLLIALGVVLFIPLAIAPFMAMKK